MAKSKDKVTAERERCQASQQGGFGISDFRKRQKLEHKHKQPDIAVMPLLQSCDTDAIIGWVKHSMYLQQAGRKQGKFLLKCRSKQMK